MSALQRRGSGRRPSRPRSSSPDVSPLQPPKARRSAHAARQTRSPSVPAATEQELHDPHKWVRKGSGRRLRSPKQLRHSASSLSASPARKVRVKEGTSGTTHIDATTATAQMGTSTDNLSLPLVYTIALAVVTIAGKAGDALGPALVGSHPLLLLVLNANDMHLAVTSTTVPLMAWTIVGMIRRLAEDPVRHVVFRVHAVASKLTVHNNGGRYSS